MSANADLSPKSTRRRLCPALIRRPQAAAMCGLGLSTFDRHDAAGLVPAARFLGGAKVWSVAELREWARCGCPARSEWLAIWKTLLLARRTGRTR